MHANFSNTTQEPLVLRKFTRKSVKPLDLLLKNICSLELTTMRLTGEHETQSIDEFSFGVSDRGASIRIPKQRKRMERLVRR